MDRATRRQELLKAARDVFATKGYHDAKVEDICSAARVAKGTFYLYFPDKRSVFAELVDAFFARIAGAIVTVDPAVEVEAQIKHNIRGVVAVLLDDPPLTQILLSYAAGLDPAFIDKIQSFYGGVQSMFKESLAVGQALGIVAPGDAGLYATFTLGALKEILLEQATGRIGGRMHAREEIVTAMFEFLQAGYLRIVHAPTPTPPPAATTQAPPSRPAPKKRRER